jgi:large subunit ribosomal protein L3
MKFLIGKKLGMTTLFDEEQGALNMTLIECAENTVKMHRTKERDGYLAVALEAPQNKRKQAVKEFRLDKHAVTKEEAVLTETLDTYAEGKAIGVDVFAIGDTVQVTGITKAKGFQGVVKRHGFHGAPASHGRKHDMRKPGSIGATFPQHVIKGKRMAGRMGGGQYTVKNLKVVYVDAEKQLLGVKGAVPGVNGRLVQIAAR